VDHAALSLAATISIGIPLFVVAMTSQNMPGIAVLRADGYTVPASPLITTTGIASCCWRPSAPRDQPGGHQRGDLHRATCP
jgi:predicted benzoate:H+ symporter BenE